MKNRRAITILASAVLFCAGHLQATTIWTLDSADGFNLSLSGTGIPFDRTEEGTAYYEWYPLGDAFPSPSGQWIIQAALNVQIFRNSLGQFTGLDYQMVGNVWNTTLSDGFLLLDFADPGLVSSHYSEVMTEKYQSGDSFASWTTAMATDFYALPLYDPSTWGWTLNISANNPNLTSTVPEYGTTFAYLALGLLGMFLIRFSLVFLVWSYLHSVPRHLHRE